MTVWSEPHATAVAANGWPLDSREYSVQWTVPAGLHDAVVLSGFVERSGGKTGSGRPIKNDRLKLTVGLRVRQGHRRLWAWLPRGSRALRSFVRDWLGADHADPDAVDLDALRGRFGLVTVEPQDRPGLYHLSALLPAQPPGGGKPQRKRDWI